jgi:hypothetical protein
MLALLTALLFIAPSGEAYAQSRSFQMALWADTDSAPGVDTDIPMIYDPFGVGQPAGRSILIRFDRNRPFYAGDYDWSRIAAVLFDEPYNEFRDPCWRDAELVKDRIQLLAQRAAELKAVAPKTRFWVNLAPRELDLMMGGACTGIGLDPVYFNWPYIDVISVDHYNKRFNPDVKKYYDWLMLWRAKPDQQVALIPGTFYRQGKDNPATAASYLQGYFDYANNANQNCNLPFGSRGLTGSFDGCPVWIVMGWLSHNHWQDGVEYVGERDPRSKPIADVWQAQVALPLRPDLAHQPTLGEVLPALLSLFPE